MPVFKDNKGRAWEVDITSYEYRAVLRELNIDLGLATAEYRPGIPLNAAIDQSPDTVIQLLWVVLADQVKGSDKFEPVTFDEFYDRLFGDCTEKAKQAFLEAWILFFRNLGRATDAQIIERTPLGMRLMKQKGLDNQDRLIGEFSTPKSKNTPPSPESNAPSPTPSAS